MLPGTNGREEREGGAFTTEIAGSPVRVGGVSEASGCACSRAHSAVLRCCRGRDLICISPIRPVGLCGAGGRTVLECLNLRY